MSHAPRFFDTTYSTRVIAIHARVLYTSAEIQSFWGNRTGPGWDHLVHILARHMASADLRVPTLEQVEEVEREIG